MNGEVLKTGPVELVPEIEKLNGRRKLVLWPDPVLTTPALDVVEHFDNGGWLHRLHCLLMDMRQEMISSRGIGLAAPQIGLPVRIAIIQLPKQQTVIEMVNPYWVAKSEKMTTSEAEGCLSLPDWRWDIQRHEHIEVAYYDRDGKYCEIGGDGLLALALQHELDHLDGKLIMDRAPDANKKLVEKRMRTYKEKLARKGR